MTRYLFFGGKGGVGKTTAAAAAALHLLEQAQQGERILLFSTDPAHSLSDSLDTEIGDGLTEVARRGSALLIAREMDAVAALAAFRERHQETISRIAERGTFLDESDIRELLNLSLPGMDEMMALFELSELERSGAYTHIIVDTAPSGHTSRLLRLPETLTRWIVALDRMADKHRYIVAHFARGGRVRADEADLFLREVAGRIQHVRAMLHDGDRTSFTLVTIPEALSVEETVRYLALLQHQGVPVTDLIINRIEHEHDNCPYCRARASAQQPWLERITREFGALRLHSAPLLPTEVRGRDALRHFAGIVWEGLAGADNIAPEKLFAKSGKKSRKVSTATARAALEFAVDRHATHSAIEPHRLLVFGGKGGVGKTTTAAAAALALAEADRRSHVLIFSTDPAHSLSDSFDEPVGEWKRGVAGCANLEAMEIDPVARFEALKDRYRAWTDELFTALMGNSRWQVQFDRESMRELVELAPPGMDEIAALSTLSALLEEDNYTSIVVDTAPAGHLVRFLELPGVALSWVRTFIKLLLKYKDVVRWDGVAEELLALARNIKRLITLLTDARQCRFVGVAIPEHMSLEETQRLSAALQQLEIPMSHLLINNIVPAQAAAACTFCTARHQAQRSVTKAFRQRLGDATTLFVAPQQPHEIRGRERLREHFASWQPLA